MLPADVYTQNESVSSDSRSQKFLRLESTTVTEFFRRKAEVELHETDEKYKKCLKEFKSMILMEGNWKTNIQDDFLLRFLRTKKFDCRRAFHLFKSYHAFRKQHKALYEDFRPSCVKHVMDANIYSFLPYRTPSGCAIALSRLDCWDPDTVSFMDVMKFGLMCMEKVADNPISQICGMVAIVDCQGMGWKHLIQLSPSNIRCFVTGVQDSFPIRQKGVHVVNDFYLFRLLFAIIRPLLNGKMKDRIYFHGKDLSSLHRYIPADILPEEYGGHLGQSENSRFYESLLQSEETFVKNQKFGYFFP